MTADGQARLLGGVGRVFRAILRDGVGAALKHAGLDDHRCGGLEQAEVGRKQVDDRFDHVLIVTHIAARKAQGAGRHVLAHGLAELHYVYPVADIEAGGDLAVDLQPTLTRVDVEGDRAGALRQGNKAQSGKAGEPCKLRACQHDERLLRVSGLVL